MTDHSLKYVKRLSWTKSIPLFTNGLFEEVDVRWQRQPRLRCDCAVKIKLGSCYSSMLRQLGGLSTFEWSRAAITRLEFHPESISAYEPRV
jgi:hypothetical protein